jgi:hypothetical protein
MSDSAIQMIRNTRLRFGEPPREFPKGEQAYLSLTPPSWCNAKTDALHEIYRQRELLLREGRVVWGHLIQANELAFKPGPQDVPGDCVYCSDYHWHDDLVRLGDIAAKLFELKGKGATADEKAFGKQLAAETERFVRYPVPKSLAQGSPIFVNSFMIARKHLPTGYLGANYFPILVHPETKAILLVPARYWDPELYNSWIRD